MTGRSDVGPNFFVIGAMRAGTTTLFGHLSAHPDVFMPDDKEPTFFVEHRNWHRGFDWYESLFAGGSGATAVGDGSTAYSNRFRNPGVPERIARYAPDARIVYVVRDPIERMLSDYHHQVAFGYISDPIDEIALDTQHMLGRSLYGTQLDAYADHFPSEQIRVVTFEQLTRAPVPTMQSIFAFLGVDPSAPVDVARQDRSGARLPLERGWITRLKHGPARGVVRAVVPRALRARIYGATLRKPPIDREGIVLAPDVEARVRERIRPDVVKLRDWLGADFDCWGLGD